MKKLTVLLLILVAGLFLFTGCEEMEGNTTVEQKEKEYTEQVQEEMDRQIGQPLIDDFFEKKMFKKIYELRDNSELVCYAYRTNLEGKLIYIGKTIGYGLPYSIQYTSPEKIVDYKDIDNGDGFDWGDGWGDVKMPQAEPNGLYMPEGLSATWLIMINEETGELKPAYYEPNIIVTQTKKPRRLVAEWSLPEDY
jgi:hypothetical protein